MSCLTNVAGKIFGYLSGKIYSEGEGLGDNTAQILVAHGFLSPITDRKWQVGWLERWPKNIVSSRDIRIWGPLALHNREAAIHGGDDFREAESEATSSGRGEDQKKSQGSRRTFW
jgi:hypothetical protein